jgi:hypothetical protein
MASYLHSGSAVTTVVEIAEPKVSVVEVASSSPTVVFLSDPKIKVEYTGSGIPGRKGDTGPSGGEIIEQQTLIPLSALKAIKSIDKDTVGYCSAADAADAVSFLGVTQTSGSPVFVRVKGDLDGFTGLTPSMPVYVGLNGELTQSAPAHSFVLRVGFARSPTTLFINPGSPVYR